MGRGAEAGGIIAAPAAITPITIPKEVPISLRAKGGLKRRRMRHCSAVARGGAGGAKGRRCLKRPRKGRTTSRVASSPPSVEGRQNEGLLRAFSY